MKEKCKVEELLEGAKEVDVVLPNEKLFAKIEQRIIEKETKVVPKEEFNWMLVVAASVLVVLLNVGFVCWSAFSPVGNTVVEEKGDYNVAVNFKYYE